MAFAWELTKEIIHLPLGCLQGGKGRTVVPVGLVFKAHGLLYHSTLGSRVIKKKERANRGSHWRHWRRWLPPRPTYHITLVTGPRRSLSLKLSDTRVYEPQIRWEDRRGKGRTVVPVGAIGAVGARRTRHTLQT